MEVPPLCEIPDLGALRNKHKEFNRYVELYPIRVLPFVWRELYFIRWLKNHRPDKYLFFDCHIRSFESFGNQVAALIDDRTYRILPGACAPSQVLGPLWINRVIRWTYLPWHKPNQLICRVQKVRNVNVLPFINRYHLCRVPISDLPIWEEALASLWKKE